MDFMVQIYTASCYGAIQLIIGQDISKLIHPYGRGALRFTVVISRVGLQVGHKERACGALAVH